MSEIIKTFSLEYETGSKTGTLPSDIPTPATVSTEPFSNASTSGALGAVTELTPNVATSGISEAGAEPVANALAYDIAKPRRIVTRGRIEHEPQS